MPLIDEKKLKIEEEGFLDRLNRWAKKENWEESNVPSLSFIRIETPSNPISYFQEPGVCLIAQGAKRVLLGKELYEYNANHYLITAMDVPVTAQVTEASREKPYLALMLTLGQQGISQLMVDSGLSLPSAPKKQQAMTISYVTVQLLSAFNRLIDLLDDPESISVMSPIIQKEILYRLLISEQGSYLMQIGTAGSKSFQIARAISWLKKNFTNQLKIEELASFSQMSTSTFHHHFKAFTAMSPLQYQKRLRLQEARRLMLAENIDAANAGFRVGYESPSQFSREYSRMFDVSPVRDIKILQKEAQQQKFELSD